MTLAVFVGQFGGAAPRSLSKVAATSDAAAGARIAHVSLLIIIVGSRVVHMGESHENCLDRELELIRVIFTTILIGMRCLWENSGNFNDF